ncbi:hypothetical protein Hanom_Chr00s100583g01803571 [Helianthus anomalus]
MMKTAGPLLRPSVRGSDRRSVAPISLSLSSRLSLSLSSASVYSRRSPPPD